MISPMAATGAVARLLLVVPIVVFALAMVPTVLIFPVLSDAQGRRVLAFVRQLRAWHAEVVERITCGQGQIR